MANGLSSGQKPTGVADLDSSQTLQNKTLDASNAINGAPVTGSDVINPSRLDVKKDTQANLVTYASTASNGQIVYATDSKKMFQVQESALAEIGSGAGGINYISNPDFEVNADGWTGDTNLTIARSAVSPLRGDASGVVSKSAINANGQSVKIPFTIDTADLAKKLYISLDKDASDANYADADLRLEIIKDPNGTPVTIRCNAEDLLGGKGSHLAWFQSDAAILEYELVIKCNSVNALAYSVKVDNVSVGPREASYGGAMTDWNAGEVITIGATTTPPTKGTTAQDNIRYRRVGKNAEIEISYRQTAAGVTGNGKYLFTLPSGLRFDESVSLNTVDSVFQNNIMYSGLSLGAASTSAIVVVIPYDATRFRLLTTSVITDAGSSTSDTFDFIGSDIISLANTNLSLKGTISVPIQGWSSNSVQSEDIGNREVRVIAQGNASQVLTSNVTPIPFIKVEDTTNSWDGDQFTVPETGMYNITGTMAMAVTATYKILRFYVNNSIVRNVTETINGINWNTIPFSQTIKLNKGDVFELRIGDSATTLLNSTAHYLCIQKLAQPQTILETETVAASYSSNSGSTIASGANVVYEDKDFDTHGAYNASTGDYTIPTTGYYTIRASGRPNSATPLAISIYINAIEKSAGLVISDGIVNVIYEGYCVKGQIVNIKNTSGTSRTLNTSSVSNTFSIARIK